MAPQARWLRPAQDPWCKPRPAPNVCGPWPTTQGATRRGCAGAERTLDASLLGVWITNSWVAASYTACGSGTARELLSEVTEEGGHNQKRQSRAAISEARRCHGRKATCKQSQQTRSFARRVQQQGACSSGKSQKR